MDFALDTSIIPLYPVKARSKRLYSRLRWSRCEHNTLVQWFLQQKNPFPKASDLSSFAVLFNTCRTMDGVQKTNEIQPKNVRLWFQNQRQRLREKLIVTYLLNKDDVDTIMRYDPRHQSDIGTRIANLLGWEKSTQLEDLMIQK